MPTQHLLCCPAVPNSILFLGRPGVGKTTVIREMARVLADDLQKRVVIVDTSNEIGGDGDVPHPAIGGARRMQVPDPSQQHKVMVSSCLGNAEPRRLLACARHMQALCSSNSQAAAAAMQPACTAVAGDCVGLPSIHMRQCTGLRLTCHGILCWAEHAVGSAFVCSLALPASPCR